MMIKLLLTGDFCPIGPVEEAVLAGDANRTAKIIEDILPIAAQCDYRVVNLECPLTRSESPIEKTGPNLKADPKTAALLKNLNVDLVAMANNHIYDQGAVGLKDTLETCHAQGIATVGAGETLDDAQNPHIAEIKGKRIAFVNFAENEFCNADSERGGANPLDIVDNTHQIQAAKAQADAVIVIIHGGHEHFHYPSPRMVKTYRFFAEQGASAIIGHHPHCIAGYEVYQGVPIFYSLGNFLFFSATTFPGWYEGFMVELTLSDSCGFKIHPFRQCQDKFAVEPLNGTEQQAFMDRLQRLSDAIGEAGRIDQIWTDYAAGRSKSYLYAACMRDKMLVGVLNRLNLLTRLIGRHRLLCLLNYIRCESHRDLLIEAFRNR